MKRRNPRSSEKPNSFKWGADKTTTTAIAADSDLGYKIRVLIYDMRNVSKDPNSERRINTTVDEHYISRPYFDDKEAQEIKSAIVDVDPTQHNQDLSGGSANAHETGEDFGTLKLQDQTVEMAIRILLNSFLDKRHASGDSRPCGPHHLAPLYASIFGIQMEEIKEAKFLGRLRRSGL